MAFTLGWRGMLKGEIAFLVPSKSKLKFIAQLKQSLSHAHVDCLRDTGQRAEAIINMFWQKRYIYF